MLAVTQCACMQGCISLPRDAFRLLAGRLSVQFIYRAMHHTVWRSGHSFASFVNDEAGNVVSGGRILWSWWR